MQTRRRYFYNGMTVINHFIYGFTDQELDYLINYDIKYRMGQDDEEQEA